MNPTATVAKAIREELKRLYPNVKFSITSKISAGSDRINIKYDSDIPKSEIKKITNMLNFKSATFDFSNLAK